MGKINILKKVDKSVSNDFDFEESPSKNSISSHVKSSRKDNQNKVSEKNICFFAVFDM